MDIRNKNVILTGASGGTGRAIAERLSAEGARLILVGSIGWPEKLFVRINALLPAVVDSSLRKQLPTIRRFAKHGI